MSTDLSLGGNPQTSAPHHRVVVGFDASDGANAVLEWAAREAISRMSTLRVVTCWAVPSDVDFYGVGARQTSALEAAADAVRHAHPGLVVQAAATPLDPRDALIDEASGADLLVLGSSEPGAARALLLGSVARTAARRSPCPVVVVRGPEVRDVHRIVVGTDGSSAAMAALDWACDEANRHGAELVVIHTWEHHATHDAARALLDEAVLECRRRTANAVRGELVEGTPEHALARASRDADLVAIGSRGRSGFKTALFGSVALSVAEHSECPIAITHPRMRR